MKLDNIVICGHPDHVDIKLLEHAAEIAKHNQARVKVVHIVSDYPENINSWWNVRDPENLQHKIVQEREDFLGGLTESLQRLGVQSVTQELHWGKPAEQVAKKVLRGERDLVMFPSSHGNKSASGVELLRQCSCPLWIAPQTMKKRVHRIYVCLNGKDGEVKMEGANAKVMDYATTVARAEASELHIIHAISLQVNKVFRRKNNLWLRPDLIEYLEEMRDMIEVDCTAFLADYDINFGKDRVHLLIGNPSDVIAEFVEAKGADLIVMATSPRTRMQGLVSSNTTEKVLKKISCPVLVVKSDEFKVQMPLSA